MYHNNQQFTEFTTKPINQKTIENNDLWFSQKILGKYNNMMYDLICLCFGRLSMTIHFFKVPQMANLNI